MQLLFVCVLRSQNGIHIVVVVTHCLEQRINQDNCSSILLGVPPRQSTVDIIVVVDPANVESTAMSPINSSQGVTSQFYPATFETTSIHGSLAPTILSSAVSKSSLQNVTTTAGNGQRTATNLGGQQTITAEDGQRT